MLSRLLCGAILASAAASAAAGPSAQTWDFTYTGFNFLDAYSPQPGLTTHFVPDATISGRFSGTDRNGDGVLSADELTSFIVHSLGNPGTEFAQCGQNSTAFNMCSVQRFSFGPNNDLSFYVTWNANDKYGSRWSDELSTGFAEFDRFNGRFSGFVTAWLWSDQTQLIVSPAPVPEPSRAALALAGMLALGLATLPLKPRFDRQKRSPC